MAFRRSDRLTLKRKRFQVFIFCSCQGSVLAVRWSMYRARDFVFARPQTLPEAKAFPLN